MRRNLLRTIKTSPLGRILSTKLAVRQGENGVFCFFVLPILPHLAPLVKRFLKFFWFFEILPVSTPPPTQKKLFGERRLFSPQRAASATRHTTFFSFFVFFAEKNRDFSKFFLLCIVFHEKFDKKSSILDIAFFAAFMYNNKAVGGTNTTASRTTSHDLAEYQAYDINAQDCSRLCFFKRLGTRPGNYDREILLVRVFLFLLLYYLLNKI